MNLASLRQVAEAATPGPWIQLDRMPYLHATSDPKAKPWSTPVVGRFDYSPEKDMPFVAAFNPQVVLALIAVAEAAAKVSPKLDLKHSSIVTLHAALAVLEKMG